MAGRVYFCIALLKTMENLKRKNRLMLFLEVAIYVIIAVSVALLIIL